MIDLETDREILTVSQLNQSVRELLEGTFMPMWIEGEISNFSLPSSGHMYFSLKDATAQVRCAMFRNQNRHISFKPQNGMHVLIRAQISLYEARGDYQLIADQMEEAGDGALRRAFDQLKLKLANEGLFNPEHKKPLPTLPRHIGVITSPTGAAIRDVLSVLKRRFPAIPVTIYPTQVQGTAATQQIVNAIQIANQRNECDVLILTRGGGSLEDLWCFNEEPVARAIYQSQIPIVAGVGHEIDVTIADFVADHRAATPSAAAELVSPDQAQWYGALEQLRQELYLKINRQFAHLAHRVEWLQKCLRHPGQRLRDQMQQLDHQEQRLQQAIAILLHKKQASLHGMEARLLRKNPQQQMQILQSQFAAVLQKLGFAMERQVTQARERYTHLIAALNSVSPLATLQRGYAIVTKTKSQELITHAKDVQAGDEITAQLAHGQLICEVRTVTEL